MASAPPQIPGLTDWRPLARGGFATVYEARQESLNRLVAVKVDQRRLDTESERRRFLREAGAAGRMSGHPGIVTVHDAGILGDDRPFLVMELCPGGSLTRWLKPDARPTQRRVRDVGVRIADALAATHARGVLHRDVKPANILIDAYDHAGLADFGLAAMPEPGEELAETLEGFTPAYAPPEVFRQETPSERGDVYALAATLYALLAGGPPRGSDGNKPSIGTALQQLKNPIEPIAGVDRPLMDALLAALADDATDRPTAAQFRDRLVALDLPDALPGSVPADPAPPEPAAVGPVAELSPALADGDHTEERRERRRSMVVLAIVSVLVALAVAVTMMIVSSSNQTAQPSGRVTAGPVTTAPSTSSTPAPTSTPTPVQAVPEGFIDCSESLGERTYCAASYQCWGGLISFGDLPGLGTAASCEDNHVYQTFAAGEISGPVRRQSDVEKNKRVKKVCTTEVANSMLRERDRRDDWEVLVLPPQPTTEDSLYRCIVGRGERSKPLLLQRPR